MSVIEAKGLAKYYGKIQAVKGINLRVEEGELFGFIGPNGAGKSTVIKLLLNFIFPTLGSSSILGMDSIRESEKIKRVTAYVPSEIHLYSGFTVKEMLEFTLYLRRCQKNDSMIELAEFFELDLTRKVNELSYGNKKKLSLVLACSMNPKVLILDEPSSGLDPIMQMRLFEMLLKMKHAGTTIFLSSHILKEVETYCDRAAFIRAGEIFKLERMSDRNEKQRIIKILGAVDPEPLLKIGAKLIKSEGSVQKFSYDGSLVLLSEVLYFQSIENYTVEELSLESEFLEYYGGE